MRRRPFLALTLTLLTLPLLRATEQDAPLFSFGVVADIQYADKDTAGKRRYRESIGKLAHAIPEWNARDLAFVVELGDITDDRGADSEQDLTVALSTFKPLKAPLYHVLGNHTLPSLGRAKMLEMLGLKRAYYDFAVKDWRFIVLDGMDLSVAGWPAGSEQLKAAEAYLEAHKDEKRNELVKWNGGIGDAQKKWLAETLAQAVKAGEKVIVFCHHPAVREASNPHSVLWNLDEIAKLLEDCPAVMAYVAGHAHHGGYALQNGVHHVTLQGLVEAPEDGNCFGVVSVFPDRLVIEGQGTLTTRELKVRSTPTRSESDK